MLLAYQWTTLFCVILIIASHMISFVVDGRTSSGMHPPGSGMNMAGQMQQQQQQQQRPQQGGMGGMNPMGSMPGMMNQRPPQPQQQQQPQQQMDPNFWQN